MCAWRGHTVLTVVAIGGWRKEKQGYMLERAMSLPLRHLKDHIHIIPISDYVYLGITFVSSWSLFNISLKPCPQCPGASLLATEINLPGLLPLMPRSTPLRGMSISGGLQNLMCGHDILPSNMDEAQPHYTHKCECDISPLPNYECLDVLMRSMYILNEEICLFKC